MDMRSAPPSDDHPVDELPPQQEAGRSSRLLAGLDGRFAPGPISVGGLMDALGDAGLGLLLIVFALPSFIPTPGLPVGFVSGTVVALIALQVMAGRHTLWMPERLRRVSLPREFLVKGAAMLARPLAFFERWLKPRHAEYTGPTARMFLAVPIFVLAVSIVLPIPLGNQLPSIALIAFGFGLIERDGLAILAAIILSCVALAWNGFIVVFGAQAAIAATTYLGSLGWF
jgi:hypothetical protein